MNMGDLSSLGGVDLDADQLALRACGFPWCGKHDDVEPLYLIVYRGRVCAVCERCYRAELRKGDP